MTQIKFHVEGGAGKAKDIEMREAFRKFFAGLNEAAQSRRSSIRFILHGSRGEAYKQFCHALKREPGAYHVLLVDSEDPVKQQGEGWRHLQECSADSWTRPDGVEEAQCQPMVQAIEAWFFADPDTLQAYYESEFQKSSLPARQNVEEIPKREHLASPEAASRQTRKGPYHKTRHLPDILGKLNVAKVRERAWHCDQIFVTLAKTLGAELTPLCKFPQEA